MLPGKCQVAMFFLSFFLLARDKTPSKPPGSASACRKPTQARRCTGFVCNYLNAHPVCLALALRADKVHLKSKLR